MTRGALALLLLAACSEAAVPDVPARDAAEVFDAEPDAGAVDPGDARIMNDDVFIDPDRGRRDDGVLVEDDAGLDAGVIVAAKDPVVFVHGIGGSSAEFAVMIDRLVADGWPRDQLVPIDFEDPRWGCNADNAETIRMTVDALLTETGATRVDLVAHSMGTLSSRQYVKSLGGLDKVSTYVTLGGLHHGNSFACLNPLPVCVWQELCPDNPFLMSLNADPAAPGDLHYVSICSTTDETAGLDTCHFDPAENIEVTGVDHAGPMGLLEDEGVYLELRRVLEYPSR